MREDFFFCVFKRQKTETMMLLPFILYTLYPTGWIQRTHSSLDEYRGEEGESSSGKIDRKEAIIHIIYLLVVLAVVIGMIMSFRRFARCVRAESRPLAKLVELILYALFGPAYLAMSSC